MSKPIFLTVILLICTQSLSAFSADDTVIKKLTTEIENSVRDNPKDAVTFPAFDTAYFGFKAILQSSQNYVYQISMAMQWVLLIVDIVVIFLMIAIGAMELKDALIKKLIDIIIVIIAVNSITPIFAVASEFFVSVGAEAAGHTAKMEDKLPGPSAIFLESFKLARPAEQLISEPGVWVEINNGVVVGIQKGLDSIRDFFTAWFTGKDPERTPPAHVDVILKIPNLVNVIIGIIGLLAVIAPILKITMLYITQTLKFYVHGALGLLFIPFQLNNNTKFIAEGYMQSSIKHGIMLMLTMFMVYLSFHIFEAVAIDIEMIDSSQYLPLFLGLATTAAICAALVELVPEVVTSIIRGNAHMTDVGTLASVMGKSVGMFAGSVMAAGRIAAAGAGGAASGAAVGGWAGAAGGALKGMGKQVGKEAAGLVGGAWNASKQSAGIKDDQKDGKSKEKEGDKKDSKGNGGTNGTGGDSKGGGNDKSFGGAFRTGVQAGRGKEGGADKQSGGGLNKLIGRMGAGNDKK